MKNKEKQVKTYLKFAKIFYFTYTDYSFQILLSIQQHLALYGYDTIQQLNTKKAEDNTHVSNDRNH